VRVVVVALVSLVAAIAGCGDRLTLPNSPTTPPPAPAPANTGVSAAILAISNLRAIEIPPRPNDSYYSYPVKFLLTETTGKSGATITEVRISSGSDTEILGPLCWRTPIHVAPGGTLDTFDAGWDSLAYCAPAIGSRTNVSSLSVLIRYVDDEGGLGTLMATAAVTR
jgi:hypothetical protein